MKQIYKLVIIVCLLLCAANAKADIYNSMKTFNSALLCLDSRYVDTVNVDALTETAIKAMLKELDPHSTYLSPKEVEQMNEGLGGSFEGIGVRYQMEKDTLLVINTVTGGPSEKVGILAGDRIIMVGDSTIAGQKFNTNEIQRRLRGPKGSVVDLGIMRQGERELLWFKVERDKIPVYSIDASYMAAPEIGYIRLSRFAQTTPEEFDKAMGKLDEQGMKHLIIDLQDNGGGYLNSAVELADFLLPSSELVVYTEGRSAARTREEIQFSGRLVGGCLDILATLCGTAFDRTADFAERCRDEGVVWFLEACDLSVFGIRRALWQLKNAGWFRHVKGFLIGRPLAGREELMGLNHIRAVTEALEEFGVPILMDTDIGHLPPMIPLISGSIASVRYRPAADRFSLKMELK